jgi:glycosyltransferase involved in cell wall biosynthesis
MDVVPLGITMNGYERRTSSDDVFRVGYFARIAPEKGLHVLAGAYQRFRDRTKGANVRLEVAGYLGRAQTAYFDGVRQQLQHAGLGAEFTYHGAVDRDGKLAFLRMLDVLSVPAPYDEPKGVFLLEALAAGVPVVQPRRGAFTEIVEQTGGGLLVTPDDEEALADGLYRLWSDRALRDTLADRGYHGVRAQYTIQRSTDQLLAAYDAAIARAAKRAPEPSSLAASR